MEEINNLSASLLDKEFAGESMEFSDIDITKVSLALGSVLNSRIWGLNEDDKTKLRMVKKCSEELRELVLKWSDVDYHELTKYLK